MSRTSTPTSTSTRRNSPPSRAERDPPTVVVLGVDPGTLVTGYGIVARREARVQFLACGLIRNASSLPIPLRLRHIHEELSALIERFRPDEFAIESAFHGRNAQSALKLGHARGVSLLAAVQHDIPTAEYSPREVKKAVVGNGAASKRQVQYMVKSILHIADPSMVHDASDALAVSICHLHRLGKPARRYRDWKSYLEANPGRIQR